MFKSEIIDMKKYYIFLIGLICFAGFYSCDDENNYEVGVQAVFEYEILDDNSGTVIFDNISVNADSYSWDFGDGNTSNEKNPVHTYTRGGSFPVLLTATGNDGNDQTTRTLIVAPNLVNGGNMENELAWNFKQVWTDASNAVEHQFVDGEFKFDNAPGTEYSQSYLWQEIPLEAGKEYRFNANLRTAGTEGLWFEVYFGKIDPDTDGDYWDSRRFQIQDCLNDPVDSDINVIAAGGCVSELSNEGYFTLSEDELTENGTIYLVFKTGSWGNANNYNDGLFLDNVSIIERLD